MKYTKLILICLIIIIAGLASSVSASEVTGTISTGLSGNVNDKLTGTVVPPTTNPGGAGNGGGGGGGEDTPTTIKVDSNGDGKTDILDFNSLLINWGKTGSGNIADFDKNGTVDIFDFNLLLINWSK
jgi:hypothetical protein